MRSPQKSLPSRPRGRVRRSNYVIGTHPGLESDLDEVCGDKEGRRTVVAGRRDGDEGDDERDEQGGEFHLFFFSISRSESNRWGKCQKKMERGFKREQDGGRRCREQTRDRGFEGFFSPSFLGWREGTGVGEGGAFSPNPLIFFY